MSDDTWKLEDVRTDAFPNPSMNPVRDLAHRLEHVEKSLEDAEALVEKFSDERTHLRTEALPNAFKMLGLTQLSFGDGKTLALVNVIKAKLPADPVKREATLVLKQKAMAAS
jgi:hypothetical protein